MAFIATTPPFRRADRALTTTFPLGAKVMARSSSRGGLCVFVAHPGSVACLSGLAVRLSASDHMNFAIPGLEDANGQPPRAPKSVETDAFPALDSGDTEAAEADDTRA